MKEQEITKEMIEYWVGSDTLLSGYVQLLWELVNDEYEVEQMKQDIIDTNS